MFVHLHVHSHYSLLDSICRVEDLVAVTKQNRNRAIAITDHGNLFAAVEFYQHARAEGVKPIIGCEIYLAPGSRLQKERLETQDVYYHLVLLAKDLQGYKNLIKIVSVAYTEGFYYKPRADKELLAAHSKGLICLTACLKSEINRLVVHGEIEEARAKIGELSDIFGKGNLYLELQDHGIPEQKTCNAFLVEASSKNRIPLAATNDVHYMKRDDSLAHDVLLCVGTGKLLKDERRKAYPTDEFYLKSPEEMGILFRETPEALSNTLEITDKCNLELEMGTYHFPVFAPSTGETSETMLRRLCETGLDARFGASWRNGETARRFEHEFAVIFKQGFVNYFLIVWDFVNFARRSGVRVGPGRGSAAGSLVAYALGITDIDPIRHGLLFERFLNPGRKEPPDIDIDFEADGREKVIQYVKEKYGEQNVSQIITFQKMKAKAAIRDAGRVLEIPLPEVDKIAKKIVGDTELAEALKADPELAEIISADPEKKKLFEIAQQIEGLCRHASKHAAGVVISDRPLAEYVPLSITRGEVTTQFSMNDIGKIGLLKMDLLGLLTLTVIDKALEYIGAGGNPVPDLARIDWSDKATYELLSRGSTVGVFQLESQGMRDILRKMMPDKFEDIIATVALYRPGPLGSGMIDAFIDVKHGRKKPAYIHQSLASVLAETNGVIVYQEQAMMIANAFSGFSLAEADHLRKAMSKKNPVVMAQYKDKFIDGAGALGQDKQIAGEVFSLIEHFAEYGFNKSHSAAYAVLAFQTAYLKAHHPVEFLAALLTCKIGEKTEKFEPVFREVRNSGIEVLPPDINESGADFTVKGGRIRYGLAALKQVGRKSVEMIVEERERNGPFQSLGQFCRRIDHSLVNRAALETMIKAGAFDFAGSHRRSLLAVLDECIEGGARIIADRRAGQETFFSMFEESAGGFEADKGAPDIAPWSEIELLQHEKDAFGFFFTSHPLTSYREIISSFSKQSISTLKGLEDGAEVLVGGMISKSAVKSVAKGRNKGKLMARFELEDLDGSIECLLFANHFAEHRRNVSDDKIVLIHGRYAIKEDKAEIFADRIIPVEKVREELTKKITIKLGMLGMNEPSLSALRKIFRENPGKVPVYLRISTRNMQTAVVAVGSDFFVTPSDRFHISVSELLGPESISYKPSA